MLFDAHNHCLAALGGVPRRGIYDNMKTAVDKIGRGKQRQVNARFRAMASHFLLETDFCNAAAGWEKGQVEKNVRDARHRIWQDEPRFTDLATLNRWLEQRCQAVWQEIRHPEFSNRTIAEVWQDEQRELASLPPPFDGFIEHHKRVSPTCLVAFERNRYSVPASLANQVISLRVYADRRQRTGHPGRTGFYPVDRTARSTDPGGSSQPLHAHRSGHSGRVGLFTLQPGRRRITLSPDQQTV
jgi:hypothetical protein